MFHFLAGFFIPHKKNDHHAYFLRLPSQITITAAIFTLIFLPHFPHTYDQNVLGIASNISRDEIIKLTNQERTSKGLNPLTFSPTLQAAAEQKAAHMFAQNYWAHFAPDGTSPWYFFKQAGYKYSLAGENLARNFDSSGQVVAAWMASPAHRDNIVKADYQEIGIGVMNGKLNGEETTLVVQFFGSQSGASRLTKASASSVPTDKPATTPTENPTPSPTPVLAAEAQISPSPSSIIQAAKVDEINDDQIEIQTASQDPTLASSLTLGAFVTHAAFMPLHLKIALGLIGFMLVLYLTDHFVLWSLRYERVHTSRGIHHVFSLGLVLIAVLVFSKGAIL